MLRNRWHPRTPVTARTAGCMTGQEPRPDKKDDEKKGKYPEAKARRPWPVFRQGTAEQQSSNEADCLRPHRDRGGAPRILRARELQDRGCPCRKPNGWRLTENRTMLICNERSFQAHCLGGCRSVSVASRDRGRDLDVAAADNCSATNHPQETILRCHRPIGVRWSLSPLPSRS